MGESKKLPGRKSTREESPLAAHVVFEDGTDFGKIEADAGDVRIGERHLRDEIALRGPDIHGRFILLPGELLCDGHVRAAADAGHGIQEPAQPFGIGIESLKRIVIAVATSFCGSPVRRAAVRFPERVESLVGHLQHSADIGGLALIEEKSVEGVL